MGFSLSLPRFLGSAVRKRRRRPEVTASPYGWLIEKMKQTHGFQIRRWRRSMSGCASEARYANGEVRKWLEAPLPKTPISLAIFLHEVGHHAIGFNTYRPRCLEEFHAWRWALNKMEEEGIKIDKRVEARVASSLRYALAKATRRGLKEVPEPLRKYLMEGRYPER